MRIFRELGLIAIVAIAMLGCVTSVQKAPEQKALVVPSGSNIESINLRQVAIQLRLWEYIGEAQGGLLCMPSASIGWQDGRANVTSEDFTSALRQELVIHNYPIVDDPQPISEDLSSSQSDFLVIAEINKIRLSACYPRSGMGNVTESKGSASVQVSWSVFSRVEQRIIYTSLTEGYSQVPDAREFGIEKVMINAFTSASRNLLADKDFYYLVMARTRDRVLPSQENLAK